MKKFLYIYNTSRPNALSTGVSSFNYTAYKAITDLGFEYHVNTASPDSIKYNTNEEIHLHLVQIYRNPFSKEVLVAYKQLMKLLKEEHFDVIHCNTPIGGFLGRICGKLAGVPKIIYQAHGFHFYKGAPLLNWLLFYPIERWLAHYTDALITINQEDYELAKSKFRLRNNGKIYYIPGVGIDLSKYKVEAKSDKLRKSLGIEDTDIMLISAGDLIDRKNYKVAIDVIKKANLPYLKYCICGKGPLLDELKAQARHLDIEKQILFLGFRTDVQELLKSSDIFLFTTKQEGLPRSMMEAMACGLPCVASRIRGNVDLLEDGKGGYLCDTNNADEFAEAIVKLAKDSSLRKKCSEANLKRILEFDMIPMTDRMKEIYMRELHLFDM